MCLECSKKIISDELISEWDDIRSYNDFSYGSHAKIWWKCKKCNGRWEAIIKNRSRGTGCPFCNNKKVCTSNSLLAKDPELAKEWHPTKNGKLKPEEILASSHSKVWWKCCLCGHEWQCRIDARHAKHSHCINCRSVLIKNERLLDDWNYEKNKVFTPKEITHGSSTIVWWKCKKCKHEWKASIKRRSSGRFKCFKCHSLGIIAPELIKDWHPTKNGKLTYFDVSYGSGKTVWWKCKKCKHEWKFMISNRVLGCGCPICTRIVLKDGFVADSNTEAFFYLKLKHTHKDLIFHGKYGKEMGKSSFDFYIPSENKYIEITGYDSGFKYWNFYLEKIEKKRDYVENVLGAIFDFQQYKMTPKDFNFVRQNRV
jgi:hypothetical protein